MSQERGTFIPRHIVILGCTLGIICALLIGLLAFFFPAMRIRRDYRPALCVVTSASLSCDGECRNATVISVSFQGAASLQRSGRRNAPCSSASTCAEKFPCRFKQTPAGVAVHEDVSAFPPGLALFVALAAILALAFALYLFHDALRACGCDLTSATPVRVVLFVPRGVLVPALVNAVKARWPRVEARGLSYRTYPDGDGHVAVEALKAFETEAWHGAAGLVFFIGADGRNERAVLDSVPETFYRVLVLPTVEDCTEVVCGNHANDGEINGGAQESVPDSPTPGMTTCDVEQAHKALTDMADLFDSVYTVGTLEFGNHKWIAMRAISPYVPLRLSIVSCWDRSTAAVRTAIGAVLTTLTWPKPRNEPVAATRDEQNS